MPLRRVLISASTAGAMFTCLLAASPQASAATSARGDIAAAVLRVLNAERAANRLPPLRMNAKLLASARAHNLAMSTANRLAHQVTGEPVFARRIAAVKYRWRASGENVGYSTDISVDGATAVQDLMYNEQAPANGHRRNVLSRSYRDVGIDVLVDPETGQLWLTEDFGRAR